jgi:hypothetical protein
MALALVAGVHLPEDDGTRLYRETPRADRVGRLVIESPLLAGHQEPSFFFSGYRAPTADPDSVAFLSSM